MTARVYFIRPIGMDGPIKIGCSETPLARLAQYLVWSPLPLELVATAPGDFALERRLHSRFLAQHLRHEWFAASPELLTLIDDVRECRFDPASLPALNRPGWKLHTARKGFLSVEGLECARLSRALLAIREGRGLQPPAAVKQAMRIIRHAADGDRAEAVATVQAYLAAPTDQGIPIPAEWAERKRARAA